jgi:hypothetical protein
MCRVLIPEPEGKRPLGGIGYRWEDNNEVDYGE